MHPMDQIERALEREEQDLGDQLARGEISPEEYNRFMREAQREAQAEAREIAEEAAEEAYRDALGGW